VEGRQLLSTCIVILPSPLPQGVVLRRLEIHPARYPPLGAVMPMSARNRHTPTIPAADGIRVKKHFHIKTNPAFTRINTEYPQYFSDLLLIFLIMRWNYPKNVQQIKPSNPFPIYSSLLKITFTTTNHQV
jgi:hypothetical protein